METSKEIRRILLGELMPCTDGRLTAAPNKTRILHLCLYGLRNGWSAVRLFGVTRREHRMQAKVPAAQMQRAVTEIFDSLGRDVWMQEHSDALACLRQGWRSMLLTAEWEDETQVLTLCAFTGRSPMASWDCDRFLKLVEKRLGDSAERLDAPKTARSFPKWPFGKKKKKEKKKQGKPENSTK